MTVVLGILPERAGVACDEALFSLLAIVERGHPFFRVKYTRADKQRNTLAQMLLDSDYSHILMLDVDHKHPVDIVERLLVHDKPVMSGLSFRRGPPYEPTAWAYDDGDLLSLAAVPTESFQTDFVGGACLMIAREVFETIPPPWFTIEYGKWLGEDLAFCAKCREHNIPIWVDPTVQSPHLMKGWVDQNVSDTFRRQYESRSAAK